MKTKEIKHVPETIFVKIENGKLSNKWILSKRQQYNSLKYVLVRQIPKNKNWKKYQPFIDWFCNRFETSEEIIFSRSRCREVIASRYSLLYMLKEKCKLRPYHCEKIFGIDHSTFIHAIKTTEDMIETNDYYFAKYFPEGINLLT